MSNTRAKYKCSNCEHQFTIPGTLRDPNKERADRKACPRCFSVIADDEILNKMQTPKAREGMQKAFDATSEELRKAALESPQDSPLEQLRKLNQEAGELLRKLKEICTPCEDGIKRVVLKKTGEIWHVTGVRCPNTPIGDSVTIEGTVFNLLARRKIKAG